MHAYQPTAAAAPITAQRRLANIPNTVAPDSLLEMGERPAQHLYVRMSAQVIDRADLETRLKSAFELLDQPWLEGGSAQASHHETFSVVAHHAMESQPGLRGRAAYTTKRVVRRLTAWYVEPVRTSQQNLSAETVTFANDTTEAIRMLRREIEDLEFTNDRLLRRVRALEMSNSPAENPSEAHVQR